VHHIQVLTGACAETECQVAMMIVGALVNCAEQTVNGPFG